MSETRWTPGPWQITEPNGQGNGISIVGPDEWPRLPEAWLGIKVTSAEQIANANLIAAAPDLYEALENTIDYLYQQITDGCKGCFGDCASANPKPSFCPLREMQRDYDQARAALAKARGEEQKR